MKIPPSTCRPNRRASALAGMLMLIALGSRAAEPQDHLNVREPEPPQPLKRSGDGAFQLPTVTPEPARQARPGEAGTLIRHLVFRGNAAIRTAELEATAAPYLGRMLTAADIEELRQRLTRLYIERGYVNSGALLGRDTPAGDTLAFDIVEGHLRSIRLRGLERLDERYIVNRLIKDEDAPLNADELRERFQLLLEDPLFARMNARLSPGDRPGEAILDLDVVRARPYQLTAFANNYRPPSIGSGAAGIGGWVRNLSGFGDQLDGHYQDGTDKQNSARYGLAWRIPLNQRGTQFSMQYDHGESSVVEEPMRALGIKSVIDSREAGFSQVLAESLRHKFTLGLTQSERKNSTTLLGMPFSFTPGEPNGVTKVSAWRFWQEYVYRDERQAVALRSTFTQARNNLQSVAGLPPGTPEVDHRYGVWLGQAQYVRQVMDNGAQIIVRGTMQETDRTLASLDRMSIGGVYTVRGYRENQLIRDTGHIVNVEFSYPWLRGERGSDLVLIPFYDRGRGKNRGEAATVLSSAGLATRAHWQGFSLDLAVAKRLEHPDFGGQDRRTLQDKGVHVQLSHDFF